MKTLRKCKLSYSKENTYYFHRFIEESCIRRHPENPQKDLLYAVTRAVFEDIVTGEVHIGDVDCITFINPTN
jgi:hypothetical protein